MKTLSRPLSESPSTVKKQRTLFFPIAAACAEPVEPLELEHVVANDEKEAVEIVKKIVKDVPPPATFLLVPEPSTIDEVICIPVKTKNEVEAWIKGRLCENHDDKKLLVISGPSGSGKRTLVKTVALQQLAACVEHLTLSVQDLKQVLTQAASTTGFSLGGGGAENRRIFLFTNVDSLFASADGTAVLESILKYIDACGHRLPPVVFTVHDLDGKCGRLIRQSKIVFLTKTYRVDAKLESHSAHRAAITKLIRNVCATAGMPDASTTLMTLFDGDLKQIMVRLELAFRTHAEPKLDCLSGKDYEFSDCFQATKLLLDPSLSMTFEFLTLAHEKFDSTMDTLLWSNYGTDLNVHALAAAADAWSSTDKRTHYEWKSNHVATLLMALRVFRRVSGARAPTGKLLFMQFPYGSMRKTLSQYKNGSVVYTDVQKHNKSPAALKTSKTSVISNSSCTGTVEKRQKAERSFNGSTAFHRLSDLECYERLCTLKRVYNSCDKTAKDFTPRFKMDYGVSASFMEDFVVMIHDY